MVLLRVAYIFSPAGCWSWLLFPRNWLWLWEPGFKFTPLLDWNPIFIRLSTCWNASICAYYEDDTLGFFSTSSCFFFIFLRRRVLVKWRILFNSLINFEVLFASVGQIANKSQLQVHLQDFLFVFSLEETLLWVIFNVLYFCGLVANSADHLVDLKELLEELKLMFEKSV